MMLAWATCGWGGQRQHFPGGEAQRVKLASHLANARPAGGHAGKRAKSRLLYILDEPTTGLHFDDVSKLLSALRQLIDGGGSLLVIEHNLDVLKAADWIVDLGPEGGRRGGEIVAVGHSRADRGGSRLAYRTVASASAATLPQRQTAALAAAGK